MLFMYTTTPFWEHATIHCQTYLGSIVTISFVQYWLNLRSSFLCECWACSLWLSLMACLGSMILDVCPNINYSMTNRIITSGEIGTLYILPTLKLFTQPKSFSECKYFLFGRVVKQTKKLGKKPRFITRFPVYFIQTPNHHNWTVQSLGWASRDYLALQKQAHVTLWFEIISLPWV